MEVDNFTNLFENSLTAYLLQFGAATSGQNEVYGDVQIGASSDGEGDK